MPEDKARKDGLLSEMLTVNDVARLLQVHPNSVRRWADGGLLKACRFGIRGDRRFRPEDVATFVESGVPSKRKAR